MKSIVIVTGGSRGIGYAILKQLSARYDVVNLSRSNLPDYPTIQTDVSVPQEVEQAFQKIVQQYGVPCILVNCAGMVEPKGILEIPPDEWIKTLSVNLTGVFLCTQQFVRYAKNCGGKIINIASTAGVRPQPGWSAYAAAKAGVINFSLTMSEELKPYKIKVYCIAPGRCATELRKKLAPDENQSTIMQPEEVASFVGMLVDGKGLLDGQVIRVRRESG